MVYKKVESTGNYWNPEKPTEELEGVIEKKIEGDYGYRYEIKTVDGDIILTPSHTVLQNRLVDVKIGAKVKIVYDGEELPKIKGRNPTKIYTVFVDE